MPKSKEVKNPDTLKDPRTTPALEGGEEDPLNHPQATPAEPATPADPEADASATRATRAEPAQPRRSARQAPAEPDRPTTGFGENSKFTPLEERR